MSSAEVVAKEECSRAVIGAHEPSLIMSSRLVLKKRAFDQSWFRNAPWRRQRLGVESNRPGCVVCDFDSSTGLRFFFLETRSGFSK